MSAQEPLVIIIKGPPAVGKSTVARKVAERMSKAVHVDIDGLWANLGAKKYPAMKDVAYKTAVLATKLFLSKGFSVVLDHMFYNLTSLRELKSELSGTGRPLMVFHLQLSLRNALQRNKTRPGFKVIKSLDHFKDLYRATQTAAAGEIVIDAQDLSAEEMADIIIKKTQKTL